MVRFQWPRRGAAARAGSVVSAEVEDDDVNEDARSAIVEPGVLIGASLDGSSKFDKIRNNGPTSAFRQLLHLPKEEPQQRNGTIEDFAKRHSQELTDKSKILSSEVESGPPLSCCPNDPPVLLGANGENDKTQPEETIEPAAAAGTTRLDGKDNEDFIANRSGLEGGAFLAAAKAPTAATAARPPPRPPSMFHLKRWSPPRRTVPVAESSNSFPRVVKHANSSDLEATQVSDADLGDVGNALDRKSSNGNIDGSVGSVNSLNHYNNNSNNAKDLDDDDDQEVQSAANISNSNSNGEAGIEMSLRQYRRRSYMARMASWRDSLQDLKRRRRRCFWSTVALLVLVLLLIVILASSCGGGRCSSSQKSAAAASTTSETVDPKFGRLTRAPNASPTSAPAAAATTDDDAVVNQQDPLDALLGGSNPNIVIFTPTMSTSEIQAAADAIFNLQQNNEMGTERYTIYFLPGSYGSYEEPLYLQIGYYTEVAGLGATPEDVMVYGKIEVYNRCFQPDPYKQGLFVPGDGSGLCFALNSFWRSLSNLSIQIVSLNQDSCRATALFWAVSQAVSMRRVDIRGGDVSLMDYCTSTLLCKSDVLTLCSFVHVPGPSWRNLSHI
jgi:hypothetical protein